MVLYISKDDDLFIEVDGVVQRRPRFRRGGQFIRPLIEVVPDYGWENLAGSWVGEAVDDHGWSLEPMWGKAASVVEYSQPVCWGCWWGTTVAVNQEHCSFPGHSEWTEDSGVN